MTDQPYQLLPPLTAEEYAALRDDIRANGIRVPIDVDENGQLLDGHHRAKIAADLGILCPTRVVAGLTEEAKREHAMALNLARRHLTQAQRRQLITDELARDDSRSDRRIARIVGVDHKTVGAMRRERNGESPHPRPHVFTADEVQRARERTDRIRAGLARLNADIAEWLGAGASPYEIAGALMAWWRAGLTDLDEQTRDEIWRGIAQPHIDSVLASTTVDGAQ